jgi:hypothetical protein
MFKKLLSVLLLLALSLSLPVGTYFNRVALGDGALSCNQDSDGDGIPDCLDPCPDDPWNICVYILWIEWQWATDLLQDGVIRATVGQVIPLDLMLVRAPRGLREFELHFQIGDSRGEGHIAKIKRVESTAIKKEFCRSTISTDSEWQGFWIIFSCEDEDDQVRGHERALRVATIELEALEEGRSYLWSRIEAITDDQLPAVNFIFPSSAFKLEILE